MTGERVAKRSSFGSIVRKRLSDITNSQSQPKIHREDEIPPVISASEKDYIEQLVKENRTLMELLADRNKIIELTGAELQKLRVDLQKMQLQNWNLAQSNSQILAEVNLSREKLKSLRHEIVCKDALLKAKNMNLEEEKVAAAESFPQANDNNKACNPIRRQPVRSQSMGPFTASKQVSEKERVENKRRCVRRQSCRFESQPLEHSQNLFEIKHVKFQAHHQLDNATDETCPAQLGLSIKGEERHGDCAQKSEAQASQRSSIGRPLRKAVEKVQSYKEVPLKTKLRRSE